MALKGNIDLSKANIVEGRKYDMHHSYRKYMRAVYNGCNKLANSKVVICTCARDVENHIKTLFSIMVPFSRLCKKCVVLIYENDSTDNTVNAIESLYENYLKNCSDQKLEVFLSTEKLNAVKYGSTTDYDRLYFMSQIRNNLFDKVKENYGDYDYMIAIDSDVNTVSLEGLISSFGFNNWDMISANGLDSLNKYSPREMCIYYDILSLVEENENCIYRRVHEAYPPHTGLVKVKAAYGGLAIYRICPELLQCSYDVPKFNDDKHDETDPDYNDEIYGDEHAGLCLQMAQRGLNRLYINTSMLLIRT